MHYIVLQLLVVTGRSSFKSQNQDDDRLDLEPTLLYATLKLWRPVTVTAMLPRGSGAERYSGERHKVNEFVQVLTIQLNTEELFAM